jgi:formylglycine-generating enzyme required for sulfatase activity
MSNITMTTNKPDRVLRGGFWFSNANYAGCASRYVNYPDDAFNFNGFRLVLKPTTLQQNDQ